MCVLCCVCQVDGCLCVLAEMDGRAHSCCFRLSGWVFASSRPCPWSCMHAGHMPAAVFPFRGCWAPLGPGCLAQCGDAEMKPCRGRPRTVHQSDMTHVASMHLWRSSTADVATCCALVVSRDGFSMVASQEWHVSHFDSCRVFGTCNVQTSGAQC